MDPTKDSKHDGITPENYKAYKQKWDKNRRKNPSEKKNMAFFTKILKSMKMNYKQFSERSGVSQQLVSWWLTSDDVRYSKIISAFENLDIDISAKFEPLPGNNFVISENDYSIQISSLPVFDNTAEEEPGLVIDQVLAGNGRLRFLAELLDSMKMDIRGFSQNIGSTYHIVYSWFKKDDIKVSNINLIAERFQQKVIWTVKKKEDTN